MKMEENNSKNLSKLDYTLGLNQFSDMTQEEFRRRLKAGRPNSLELTSPDDIKIGDLPTTFDWRIGKKKAITGVRDEHIDCYADYAFASAGIAEAIHSIEKIG